MKLAILTAAATLVGEVLLVNVKGTWVVDEELVDLVLGK